MEFVSEGDDRAFQELYERYSKKLFGYFLRMMKFNKVVAEDALQDVFLKIAEKPQLFKTDKSFRTWIFCIASNYCKNYYRYEAVRLNGNAEHFSLPIGFNDEFLLHAEKIDRVKFDTALAKCLNELSFEKKEAFVLRYQENKSITEISEIQNCSDGTVKSRIHYSNKFLGEKLKAYNPNQANHE
ncbi:MAG: RNA polymerase sigma factor [Bacteroidia bacterium]